MDEHDDWLARRFEENRAHLRAVAYRMLGSISEADDAVQEAWLRLSRSDVDGVENLGGWLTTVVARVCLNMLRSRRSRRGESLDDVRVGVPVPDPIVSRADGLDPEQGALVADSVGLALLVVLEKLSPAERLAFVLHDVFGVPFGEIAPLVARSPTAARQLASRAPPGAGSGHFRRRRSCLPAGGRGRLPRRLARGRLRGAARGARPGRRGANRRRCRACGPIEGGPRRAGGGRADAHLLRALPVRTTGARERSRGSRRGPAWTAV